MGTVTTGPAAVLDRPRWVARALAERAAGTWRDVRVDSHIPAAAAATPGRLAVVDGDVRLTYAEAHTRVGQVAAGLRALGVSAGDVVSWQLPNWYEGYLLHHAILRLRAISNPIVSIYRAREVGFILREAGTRVVVVPEEFRGFGHRSMIEDLRADLPDLAHVVVARPTDSRTGDGSVTFDQLLDHPDPVAAPTWSGDEPILLMYTSGTTADPKGVVHTHNTLDYENRTLTDLFELTGDDVVFMPSPITHTTGLVYGVQLAPMLGVPLVLQDVWEPRRALDLIATFSCSFTFAATPFLHGMVNHPDFDAFDVSSLQLIASGGADVPPHLVRQVAVRFGATTTRAYGSTEYPTLCACGPRDDAEKAATTDGHRIAAARFRVLDESDADASPGETGELVVTGPEMFAGYLRAADEEAAFTPDGWFRTGDLGSVDEDGFITIRGRKKDIILRGAENISVVEVENLLLQHPAVRDVAVVAMPDPIMVERACAYVVPAHGATVTLAELCTFLESQHLARQKLPERLELIDDLPRTASGKVQKFLLRTMIRRRLAAEAPIGT